MNETDSRQAGLGRLFDRLRPVDPADSPAWHGERDAIRCVGVYWYPSAGLDFRPLHAVIAGLVPAEARPLLPVPLLHVMSDYDARIADELRSISLAQEPRTLTSADRSRLRSEIAPRGVDVTIERALALRLFSSEERRTMSRSLRLARRGRRPPLSTAAPVPRRHADCYFLRVRLAGGVMPVLSLCCDDLAVWSHALVPFQIGADAVASLGVGGKSGGWDELDRPGSALAGAIAAASPTLRPALWVSDASPLGERWERVGRGRVGDGVASYFRAWWPGAAAF